MKPSSDIESAKKDVPAETNCERESDSKDMFADTNNDIFSIRKDMSVLKQPAIVNLIAQKAYC